MNYNLEIIDVLWWEGVGAVLLKNEAGHYKSYIGRITGISETVDKDYIRKLGSKLSEVQARALFEEKDLWEDFKEFLH